MQCEHKSNDLPHLLKTAISLATAALLFFWVSGTTAFSAGPSSSGQEPEPTEKLIQVGQYRLNFKVIKGSSLTILLESGGGLDSREWNRMAPDLAQKTGATVVSYDRAGLGKSDLPETPYDMREEIDGLWQGLQQLELDKNLILVGHSYGGWLIRLTANDHPDAIQGMVFVDPFTTEFVDALGVEYLDNHPTIGKLPFPTTHPEKLTKIQRALVRVVEEGLGPKVKVMRNTSIPKGIPVRIITCGKGFLPKPEENEAWRQAHEQMAASIEGAILSVAEQSSHMIPWSQPDLIIEAAMEIIRLIKER